MRKLISALVCVALLTSCFGAALAEETDVAWTYAVTLSGLNDEYQILVNKDHPLEDPNFAPDDLELVTAQNTDIVTGENTNGGLALASSTSIQLSTRVVNALFSMFTAAKQQGYDLYLRAGWRSEADQQKRYDRKTDGENTDAPGTNDYQTGYACSVVNYDFRGRTPTAEQFLATVEGQWIVENCARFGFVIRFPEGKEDITGHSYEPWHLRYVGIEAAKYMTSNNLTLEEFDAEKTAAFEEFAARGGDVEEARAAAILPDGPVQIKTAGPDGDWEIILFHD